MLGLGLGCDKHGGPRILDWGGRMGGMNIAYTKVSISLPNIICFLNFRIFQPILRRPSYKLHPYKKNVVKDLKAIVKIVHKIQSAPYDCTVTSSWSRKELLKSYVIIT